MSSNFFSLPREIRDQIYKLVVLHREPISYLRDFNALKTRQKLTPQLFRANKTIHLEASSLLYSQNHFDLSVGTSEQIASFFTQIGQKNADLIRRICVNFPMPWVLEPGEVILNNNDVRVLASIQSSCANVTRLTMRPSSTDYLLFNMLEDETGPKVVTEALELVNSHFRAISPLQEIIVEMHKKGASDHIRKEMERCGWIISIIQYPKEEEEEEEEEEEGEDWDMLWNDRVDGYDDGVEDDYNTDNDSDFWRRAAD